MIMMMKWDIGETCPLQAPAVGFLGSDGKSLLMPRSPDVCLHVHPFLTIQGVSLTSPSAEAWRTPTAGDVCTSCMALFLAGNHAHHELTEAEKRWPL